MTLQQLIDAGFERLDWDWFLSDSRSGGIDILVLEDYRKVWNAVYAFVIDGEIVYIGVTTRGIDRRFTSYRNPGQRNVTDWKVCQGIKRNLEQGKKVETYVWYDKEPSQIGEFIVDRCRSFEQRLLGEAKPPWNS